MEAGADLLLIETMNSIREAVIAAKLATITGPDLPLIAYGNIGYADEAQGWINTDAVNPDSYLQTAQTWPAQIVGGCCGTTPAHIRKLRAGRNHTT